MNELESSNNCGFLCSFDIKSLFTNVPLDETIRICADALYDGVTSPFSPPFPRKIFIELMPFQNIKAVDVEEADAEEVA